MTIDYDGPGFVLEGGLWSGRKLYDLYQEAMTPWEWHAPLFRHARALGLIIFSSPFDAESIARLETLATPAFKIASFELVDLALIRCAAETGRPLILSTGMAGLGEIEEAVVTARAAGAGDILLLHCTSGYPTPAADAHLHTLPHLAAAFGVPVGLSDHSHGIAVPVAAVALGAVMVEKHFTLSRADGGSDAAFSLEPAEFRAMADACRTAWQALGRVDYCVKPSEAGGRTCRRSLYVVQDMAAGDRFTPETIRAIRPGAGLPPRYLPQVLGGHAAHALSRGTPLAWSDIAPHKRDSSC